MRTNREQLPTLSRRVLLQALLFGTLISIALLLIDGPIWTCYAAALLAAPYVFFQLRALDPARQRGKSPRSTRDRSKDH